MPRPGPRPYECIRRAWHSDSHQPLRGTLIHEIFRLVNELHGTSTRRKKEWQEKLPIVVLRAEEILYSKANSEGEYADVETLRSRLDDAVNTMIRREDGEEEGVYMVPCVEAALSLGCMPKKTPRGQRQGSSRHFSSVARRVDPARRPEDCTVGTVYMDSLCSPQDKLLSSTFGFMAQALPVQDQALHSIPHTSFGPTGAFWGPSPCYSLETSSSILTPSASFAKVLDAHHPLGTPLYPKQGALVQFLRATNASRLSGDLPPDAALYAPHKHFNFVQDSAERSGTKMVSRFLRGSAATCSSGNPPLHPFPRLPRDVGGDNHQYSASLGAITSPLHDSTTSLLMRNASSAETGMPKAENYLLPTWMRSDKALSVERNSSATPLSAINKSSASLSGDHDLQLRLGPPISESSATSASPADASAPKRMRVDVLNSSTTHIL